MDAPPANGTVGTALASAGLQNHTAGANVTDLVWHAAAGNSTDELSASEARGTPPVTSVLLLYGILFVILGSQAAIYQWKARHRRSYELVTLVGLWLVPAIFSLQLHYWRFLLVWSCYSAVTGRLLLLCLRKKLAPSTPRQVYMWFLGSHRVSTVFGMTGYVLLLLHVFGLGGVVELVLPRMAFVSILWYGLYFGILGRDCAEVASDRMALAMGFQGRRLVAQVNTCGICTSELQDGLHGGAVKEASVQLGCKHTFHDTCIRGWTLVGKKDMCPLCCEKVDMAHLNADRPWETRNLSWIQMLDSLRYLIVWNPLVFLVVQVVVHLFHHHKSKTEALT